MNIWNNDFDKYVGHYLKYQNKADFDVQPENHIKYINTDIGRKVGFERVAVHHVALPEGCRSSSPHAESTEEEFVFVISGEVDLWLNGYIYKLKAGHAVGFPAGTGVAHTFINNSNVEAELLVAGETSKDDNLCSFPINPELQKSCGIWWSQPPKQELGPHNGLPGKVLENEISQSPASQIAYCPDFKKSESFNYPGNNENFGCGLRITDEVGLNALGVHYECLEPGKRSAFPHAHTHEEEFVYVIKGRPTVWMNGFTKVLNEGEFAAFPSNTGIAHAIINDTDEDVYYICIGETFEFPDEKIYYPKHLLRNKECEQKGWLWEDVPKLEYGQHDGVPKAPTEENLRFRLCSVADAQEVLTLFNESPAYFKNTEGCLPNLNLTKKFILDTPEKKSNKYFKQFLIIEQNNKPVGVLDLHVNHPEEKHCYLGLILIKESLIGKGVGRKCYNLAESYIKNGLQCNKIRLGVSADNDVSSYWKSLGFKTNGNSYSWKGEKKETLVNEFDKLI